MTMKQLCGNCSKPKGPGEGHCTCGRIRVMTAEVLSMARQAFAYGATDAEAAAYAGVSPSSLARYLAEHDDFREERDSLKEKVILKARKAVIDALDKDPELALRFIERKRPDEFSPSLKVQSTIQVELREVHAQIVNGQRSLVEDHVIEGEIVDRPLPSADEPSTQVAAAP